MSNSCFISSEPNGENNSKDMALSTKHIPKKAVTVYIVYSDHFTVTNA